MPSNYAAITDDNIRRLGEDTDQYKSIVELYADPSHFVYELLQNADDHGANLISFELRHDQLIVEHNGTPFTEEHVKAISNIGKSSSASDPQKAGRFGLGFKSVLAYTATPQIHSGDESFELYNLRCLRPISRPVDLKKDATRFILPFNHDHVKPDYVDIDRHKTKEKAYLEIEAKLKNLGKTTLLFTVNIDDIEWKTDDKSGHYLKDKDQVTLTDGESVETYLVFQKPSVDEFQVNEHEKMGPRPLSIAFKQNEKGQIVPAVGHHLFVLFETAVETHLGFLVNGPFRTTPSRETIKQNDSLNQYLVEQLSLLLCESLEAVREMGLLDVSFLQCLPTKELNKYPDQWMFRSLHENVRKTFEQGEYLPTDREGEYASANNALLACGEKLRPLFQSNMLEIIWGSPKKWLSGEITTDKTPDLRQYLLKELEVKEVDPWDIIGRLTDSFFQQQTLEWARKFFLYAAEHEQKFALRSKNIPCIPLNSGEWVCALNRNVVFPVPGLDLPIGIDVLDSELLSIAGEKEEKIRKFLTELGVREYSEEVEVKGILKTVYTDNAGGSIPLRDHLEHMRKFIAVLKNGEPSRIKNEFKECAIFLTDDNPVQDIEEGVLNPDSAVSGFHRPQDCYLDQPLETTFLSEVFGAADGVQKRLLSHIYEELGNTFVAFAKSLGVSWRIEPEECSALDNPKIVKKGARRRRCPKNIDYKLTPFIHNLFAKGSDSSVDSKEYDHMFNASVLVWDMMNSLDKSYFEAIYQPNSKASSRSTASSQLIQELSELKWLQAKDGSWKRPCELTEATLYTGATDDNPQPIFHVSKAKGWLDRVSFGVSEQKQEAAKQLGYNDDPELLEILLGDPDIRRMAEEKRRAQSTPTLPEHIEYREELQNLNRPGATELNLSYDEESGNVKNVERVDGKLADEIEGNRENEPLPSERRRSKIVNQLEGKNPEVKQSLREWYSGECQICGHTFPKRNGEAHFVDARLVKNQHARWLDHEGNALCLCAEHHAQWEHGSREFQDILGQIAKLHVQGDGKSNYLSIQGMLIGKPVKISYCEKHFLALKKMVESGPTNSD